MSKAFTREEDGGEIVAPMPPELPAGLPNYLTPEGFAALEAAVAAQAAAPSATLPAHRAAAEARLDALRRRLQRAEVVDPATQRLDSVRFATTARIRGVGLPERVSIVGIDEADPARGRISWRSPLARALLGAIPGDVVTVTTPRGEQEVEVEAVERLG